MNLAVNAKDAIEGNGQIKLSARNLRINSESAVIDYPNVQPGDYVEVSLEDNGSGIPSKMLGQIYDPFFTTKDVGEGTGLGLSISHGIVREHDGEIQIDSTPGEGSCFTVVLPRVTPIDGELANREPTS